jgi:uncharacterized protein YegP (UPF0339 family)
VRLKKFVIDYTEQDNGTRNPIKKDSQRNFYKKNNFLLIEICQKSKICNSFTPRKESIFPIQHNKSKFMANLDNYLPCERYAEAPGHENHPGFKGWFDDASNHWYFAAVTNTDRVVLRSEAYTTEAARDNGIESVMKNRDLEERYKVVQDDADSLWYVVLKAANHQEIARSCPYDSEEEATAGIAACFSTFTERSVDLDNYMPCDYYGDQAKSEQYEGFNAWQGVDSEHYFFAAVTNKGTVVLRSQAYTTEAARDNGIESVMKNRDLEERYKVVQDEADGLWYVVLKAGNHQEIARSCPYDSEEAATAGIATCFSTYSERAASTGISDDYLPCERYAEAPASEKYEGFNTWHDAESDAHYFAVVTNTGRVVLRSEAYTTEAARDNGIESVMKNRDLEERYKVVQDEADGLWYVVLKAGNHQEIARSCPYDSEEAAAAGIATCFSTYSERAASTGISDDYLPCEHYADAPASEKYEGFNAWHDAESDAHYFAAVTNTGRVVLRSEAYTTEAARDNGIESVMKNRDLEERYKVVQDEADGLWYTILKAGNHQEIARSCPYDSEAAALAGIKSSMSKFKERDAAIIEDYLPCESYHGKEATEYEGFTQFQDPESGLYYFANVDKNGKVVLKSEGYKTATSRDNGIESVIRNRDIEDHWSQQHDDDGYYMSLRAGNHQEIARTCHFSSEGALMGWWMPFAAAAFALPEVAKAAVAAPAITLPPPVIAPPTPVITKTEPAPPPITSYTESEASTGGSNWWKWLLPLLLLAGLFFLWKKCSGSDKAAIDKPTTSVAPPPAPVPAPVAATPAPPPSCNCSAQTDPVFNVNSSATAKKLSRLGTNPEFGNSHGLSGAEFLKKISDKAATNAVDKAFMDRMYKAMGYASFADAKPDQFTEVVLPVGTTGNLGYGKQHGTGYYTLPDAERDRQAFHIKSANGCDLHFMKTCGNHFFFCPK